MNILIPSRFPVNRTHDFLVYAVGIYWEYWERIEETLMGPSPSPTPVNKPLLELYINQEKRISILPIYYNSIILLREPIYIKAEDVLTEKLNDEYTNKLTTTGKIAKSYGYTLSLPTLQLNYPVIAKPHLVLYGVWKPDVSINRKGYLLTVEVEINHTLYELNISQGTLTAEMITEWQFEYNGKLSEIYFYPNIAQITKRTIFNGEINIDINSIAFHKLVRLEYLSRDTNLDRIFMSQYHYDNAIEYTNTLRIKSIRVDKEFLAGDKLLLAINTDMTYFSNFSYQNNPNFYRDIAIFYNTNRAYPFMINFTYDASTL